jgi:hypothetical protein
MTRRTQVPTAAASKIPVSVSRGRAGAIGLAIAGLLIGLGGALHPRVDSSLEFDQGLAGMFESSAWAASHLITMAGFATLAVALAVLVRALGPDWTPRMRLIGWTAAAATGFAAVETLPHLLAASDAGAIERGKPTPLADLHTTLQAFSTPAVGLSVAAFALVGTRSRALDGGLVATALAVLGGTAFALAGPAIAISERSQFAPLFVGSAGLSIWAVVAGVRTARRLKPGTDGAERADRGLELAPAMGRTR